MRVPNFLTFFLCVKVQDLKNGVDENAEEVAQVLDKEVSSSSAPDPVSHLHICEACF